MNIRDIKSAASAIDRNMGGGKQSDQKTGFTVTENQVNRTARKDALILSPDTARSRIDSGNTVFQTKENASPTALSRKNRLAGAGNTLNQTQNAMQPTASRKTSSQQPTMIRTAGDTQNSNQNAAPAIFQQNSKDQKPTLNQMAANTGNPARQTSQFQKANQTVNQNNAPGGNPQTPSIITTPNPGKAATAARNNPSTEKPASMNAAPVAPDTRAKDNQTKLLNNELFRNTIKTQSGQNPILDIIG